MKSRERLEKDNLGSWSRIRESKTLHKLFLSPTNQKTSGHFLEEYHL